MMTSPLVFAERLGPASTRLMGESGVLAQVETAIEKGRELEDAVLLVVHARLQGDGPDARELGEEFLKFFLNKMLGMRATGLRPDLRRLLDTGDLVNSIARDFWLELTNFEFRGVGHTMSWLSKKLEWRTSDRQRALLTERRNEARHITYDESVNVVAGVEARLPLNQAELREDWNRTLIAMHRLAPRDRHLVEMMLDGQSSDEMGAFLEQTSSTARRALSRALARLRDLMSDLGR